MAFTSLVNVMLIVAMLCKGIVSEKQQLEALEEKLQLLEQKLLDMEKNIVTVNEALKAATAFSSAAVGKADNVSKNVDKVSKKMDKVKKQVDKLGTTVAFTATMTGGDFRPTSTSSPLPFSNVQVNVGKAYSNSTYKFTCPVSGMYYFSFSLYSSKLQYGTDAYRSLAYIYHGSDRVTGGHSGTHDSDSTMWAQTAASAVIRCDVGEHVEVRPGETGGNKFWSISSQPRSTFTGFLISPQ